MTLRFSAGCSSTAVPCKALSILGHSSTPQLSLADKTMEKGLGNLNNLTLAFVYVLLHIPTFSLIPNSISNFFLWCRRLSSNVEFGGCQRSRPSDLLPACVLWEA